MQLPTATGQQRGGGAAAAVTEAALLPLPTAPPAWPCVDFRFFTILENCWPAYAHNTLPSPHPPRSLCTGTGVCVCVSRNQFDFGHAPQANSSFLPPHPAPSPRRNPFPPPLFL